MKIVQEHELVGSIINWIKQMQVAARTTPIEVTEEMDLIGGGILDSLGFIDLIVYLETLTEEKIDLNDANPKDFTTIKGLCRTILIRNDQSRVGCV